MIEIVMCIRKLKNKKTDGVVGEILKYGGSAMVYLLEQLFSVIRREETVPKQSREGLIRKVIGRIQVITEELPY